MTKKLLLAALAIVVAVGFAGCGKKADQLTLTVGDSQTESENAIQKFNGTMRELMAKGQPVKCDYELTDSGMTVKSTLYVSGKMMRVEGSAPVNAKQVLTSHMILNGGDDYAYIWMDDGTGKGTKMKMEDPAAKTDGSQVKGESGSADLDAKIEFSCSKWSADDSMFKVPTNITFTDFSDMLKNLGGNMCGTCDMLPAKDKAECQANFCKK
jgi:hypothetical protein